MTGGRQPSLAEAIYRLTRGDVVESRVAPPDPADLVAGARFHRLRTLSIPDGVGTAGTSLPDRCRQMLTAAHVWTGPTRILLSRMHGEVSLSVAWPGTAQDLSSLFPGGEIVTLPDAAIVAELRRLRYAGFLTGHPLGESDSPPRASLIEHLSALIEPEDFACLVSAEPLDAAAARANHHQLAEEHTRSGIVTRLSGTVDEQDRLARSYADLLERALRSAERGIVTGAWECTTWLLAADPAALNTLGGMAVAGLAAADAVVPPRWAPCVDGGEDSPPSQCINTGELVALVTPPRDERPGLRHRPRARYSVDPPACARDFVRVGAVLADGDSTGFDLGVPVASLASHTLVSGMTGSGKTTTVLQLLGQLWSDHRIPFLVIESAKREYRNLFSDNSLSQDLRVFSLGDEALAPLRINPLEVLDGFSPQVHIDLLRNLFRASFVLYPPMPEVLELALTEVYQDRGWDLTRVDHPEGNRSPRRFPTLDDLVQKTDAVVNRLGYEDRLRMDIRASLRVRLDSLRLNTGKGSMLNVRTSTPVEELVTHPCVLELQGVASDDEKAFLIGLILVRLYEYFEVGRHRHRGGLRQVTVVEEAHRLLRRAPEGHGDVAANPRGEAVQTFANMLAEFRALGCGLIIAEQIPSKLIPDAVKNTGLKITHRIAARDDRELLAGAMGCDLAQTEDLLQLAPGEAVVRGGDLHAPTLVRVPHVGSRLQPVDDARVHAAWRRTAASQVPAARLRTSGLERRISAESCNQRIDRLLVQVVDGAEGFLETLAGLEADLRGLPSSSAVASDAVGEGLLTMGERALESRARVYGWSLAEIDRVVSRWSDLAGAFAGRRVEPVGAGHAKILTAARALGDALATSLARDRGPYEACGACERRCRYRFEVEERRTDAFLSRVRRAVADGTARPAAEEILQAAWDLLGGEDEQSMLHVCTCFAVNVAQDLVGTRRRVPLARALIESLREEIWP